MKSLIGGRHSNWDWEDVGQHGHRKDKYGRKDSYSSQEKHALQTKSRNFDRYSKLEWNKHGLQIYSLNRIGTAVPYSRYDDDMAIAIVSPWNFKLPDNLKLVSDIYQIKGTPHRGPVKIKIQHCAPKESLSDLCILTSSNECPPYRFHKVDGNFHSNFAEFYVNSFSLYLIVWRKLVGMFNPSRLLYSVSLYSSSNVA